jgi:predicted RNA-binding protein with PIN domain
VSAADAPAPLPPAVRRQLVELAAAVLGELGDAETPVALRRVRTFAPAQRARSGAVPLGVALERDAGFRQRVGSVWRAQHPELAQEVEQGAAAPPGDPIPALTGVYLLRPAGWEGLLERLVHDHAAVRDQEHRRLVEAGATAELTAARAEAAAVREDLARERARSAGLEEELAGARREARRQRADADRARSTARAAEQTAQQIRQEAHAELERARLTLRQAQDRVREATERADQARRVAREGRSLADSRARLLLDTIVDAAGGLRRELALPPVSVRPADLVAPGAEPGPATGRSPRAQDADDPSALEQLLSMPQAHLVVDGYNVTKTGYPNLPLAEQRRRLVEGLGVLVARTGAEVTCCFDGADVEAPQSWRVRGVRVLFSDPGTTADDLVRRLVRAEPAGRPVVVVSSDLEVVAGVRSSGAAAVASAALVRLLARG